MIGSAQGYLLESVLSRLRALEAQAKADPKSRFAIQFRFVALSACLANARSLAGWLNVDKGLFSFHSPRRFNHIPQDQMEEVLSRIVDPALKTVLAAGVAFFYKVESWKRSER